MFNICGVEYFIPIIYVWWALIEIDSLNYIQFHQLNFFPTVKSLRTPVETKLMRAPVKGSIVHGNGLQLTLNSCFSNGFANCSKTIIDYHKPLIWELVPSIFSDAFLRQRCPASNRFVFKLKRNQIRSNYITFDLSIHDPLVIRGAFLDH